MSLPKIISIIQKQYNLLLKKISTEYIISGPRLRNFEPFFEVEPAG